MIQKLDFKKFKLGYCIIFQNGNVNLDEPLPKTAAFLSTIAFNRDDMH